jgi:hypothetical protein
VQFRLLVGGEDGFSDGARVELLHRDQQGLGRTVDEIADDRV